MTDKLEQDVANGSRAQILLNDPMLTGAFDMLRTEYLKAWETTAARDTDARERLWQAIQIVGKVRSHLQSAVSDGKLARAEVDALSERRKRFGIV